MPKPPAVVLRRVKPDYGATSVRCPLLQQRRLAITCGSRDEGDGFRSTSAELEKPSARNNAVLRDFRPSAEGYSLEVGRSWPDLPTASAIGRIVQPPGLCTISYAKWVSRPRPASSLSDFYQLDAKILQVLQGTVKLSLVPKYADQDRTVLSLLDVQAQSLECGNECISQLTAYADLIGKALRASRHDREVATWPLLARAQIAMDISPPQVLTRAPMIG
jgi:hypothetical protein